MVSLPNPCVVLMVGASGAGKSTVAAAFAARRPGLEVLSYDVAQGDGGVCTPASVDQVHAVLAERCAAGASSVVDGTHRQADRRVAVVALATAHDLPVLAVVLRVPLASCLRNQHRRARHVPEADVRAHHAAVEAALPLLPHEGYTAVVVLDEPAVTGLVAADLRSST
ncbi:ATP-binding protein [Lentzea sp. NBRC 102530]|uniref:ATP-binding protein n=1 Tax=Lentzea sp. NBRC 102530 TaxID=3032201 RepID=UPI00255677BB|nr:ATP-binding protein [Lentzea sp. NBRC 102530]